MYQMILDGHWKYQYVFILQIYIWVQEKKWERLRKKNVRTRVKTETKKEKKIEHTFQILISEYCCCCCCVDSVLSDSMRPHWRQPTRLPRPQDSPGKNTGVGCHFLLQCIKVKSESEVAQSCPTLRDPMDCSLPGSSTHGIFQARVLEWGAIAFS